MTSYQVNSIAETERANQEHRTSPKSIKCVIWDLDNTLWDGILLEDEQVSLRESIIDIIKTLDQRGILQSIASKNDTATAMAKLAELDLSEYFLYPQINWNAKSASIREIACSINIGLDTLAFVDDQSFERDEVAFMLPEVLCIDASDIGRIPDMPEMNPRFITEDSHKRRAMYLSDIKRKEVEQAWRGPGEDFLASLQMGFSIREAREDDLQRAEELTLRTHQLNTTGYTYAYDELDAFRRSPNHKLLIAGLEDTYGTYGKVGLALLECGQEAWTLKLLLMSCRVMSRGVGTILVNHILCLAERARVPLRAEFVPNERNRMMYITYKLGGFKEVAKHGDLVVLEHSASQIQPFPPYVKILLD